MTTVLSFLFVLGVLVAIHEYGHYRVALACGVKVLRFSVGIGKPLWQRVSGKTGIEYTIGWIPLGGYVRMLDEREGAVDPAIRHLAFNNKPLKQRAAVVLAGPLANLMLAVLLYACVAWIGQRQALPIIAAPVSGSIAAQAGFSAQDRIVSAQRVKPGAEAHGDAAEAVQSFERLSWLITQAAIGGEDLWLEVAAPGRRSGQRKLLPTSRVDARMVDTQLTRQVGIVAPYSPAVIGEISANSAASKSGLAPGDVVMSAAGKAVVDAMGLREHIRATPEQAQTWRVQRNGQALELTITPARVVAKNAAPGEPSSIGRIGAVVGAAPELQVMRHGLFEGLSLGVTKTYDTAALSLRLLGKMLVGEASIKNLSGPITIADYAGKSAQLGIIALLGFMALVSVSLGVLNLLPLPMLDGGHLMYYLWEGIVGKPVSEVWQQRLQQGGVAVLMLMMSVALFNDVSRLLG